MTNPEKFDPEQHGFRKINMRLGQDSLEFFEMTSQGLEVWVPDFLRINTYMTRDGDYTTLWHGLLDPVIAEVETGVIDNKDIDFTSLYNEEYFRGDIRDSSFGSRILEATRCMQKQPSAIRVDENGKIECYPILIQDT